MVLRAKAPRDSSMNGPVRMESLVRRAAGWWAMGWCLRGGEGAAGSCRALALLPSCHLYRLHVPPQISTAAGELALTIYKKIYSYSAPEKFDAFKRWVHAACYPR